MAEKYFIAIKTAAWLRRAQNLHSCLKEKRERERERERVRERENERERKSKRTLE